MKCTNLVTLCSLGLVLALAGCSGGKTKTTVLPPTKGTTGDPTRGPGKNGNEGSGLKPVPTVGGVEATNLPVNINDLPDPAGLNGMDPDPTAFASQTVYFEFDRATVRAGEVSKIESVAAALKDNPKNKVQIEGHCDERGTEEYNRSLGERRALAVREKLMQLGVEGNRVFTISYGEDKPADPGHNDEAWGKNRRGVFILYKARGN